MQYVRVMSVVDNFIVLSTGLGLYDVRSSGEIMVYNADTDTRLLAPTIDWGKFEEIYLTRRVLMHRTGRRGFRLIMLMRHFTSKKTYVLVAVIHFP